MPSWCPPDSLQRSGTASPQAAHFSLPPGSESSVAPLRLLSPREPLRWVRAGAPIKGGFFIPHELKKRAVHRMSLFFGARGGTASPQAAHFSLPPGSESSVAPLRLLSPREPLRWVRAGAPIKGGFFIPHELKKRAVHRMSLFFGARGGTASPQAVHHSLPPGGERSVAPLWLLSPREPLRWIRAGAPIKADSSHPHRPKKDRLLPVFLFGARGGT